MLGREKWKWGQEAIVSWWRITTATKPIRLWPRTVNCIFHIFEGKKSVNRREIGQRTKTHPVTSPDLNDNTSASILLSFMNKSFVSPFSWLLFQNWARIEANSTNKKSFCPLPKMSNNMYTFMCPFQRMNISWRCSNLKNSYKAFQLLQFIFGLLKGSYGMYNSIYHQTLVIFRKYM